MRVGAVGLCGTDFHIYEGHANYHYDAAGRPIPLAGAPQVLGHELMVDGSAVGFGTPPPHEANGTRMVGDDTVAARFHFSRCFTATFRISPTRSAAPARPIDGPAEAR